MFTGLCFLCSETKLWGRWDSARREETRIYPLWERELAHLQGGAERGRWGWRLAAGWVTEGWGEVASSQSRWEQSPANTAVGTERGQGPGGEGDAAFREKQVHVVLGIEYCSGTCEALGHEMFSIKLCAFCFPFSIFSILTYLREHCFPGVYVPGKIRGF